MLRLVGRGDGVEDCHWMLLICSDAKQNKHVVFNKKPFFKKITSSKTNWF